MPKDAAFAAHKAHFGPISKELIDYVNNCVLLRSRYLFIQTKKGIQSAYCTHCKRTHYPNNPLRHREFTDCPKCNSRCMIYRANVGRKYLCDFAYVVHYQKSIIDSSVVTAVGFYVRRDYTGDFKKVETLFRPSCSYVFKMGDSSAYSTYNGDDWHRMDRVISEYSLYQNIPKYYSRESIAIAVDGTPLQYSTWEQYNEQDMTKFFALYTEHPCIEYLTKMNLTYFVKAKLYGMRTYDAINWRGKTIEQILRLKKQDIRRFLECYPQIKFSDDALALRLYQLTLNDSDRPTLGSLGKLSDSIEVLWPDLKRMFKYQSVVKCVKYVERQFQRGKKEHYRYRDSVLRMWKDYMEQCKMLEFDLSRIEVVFPHDLHAAHENTTSQVKISLSDIEKRKIAARFKTLERRYHFEFKGFVLRPAKSANEIIEEGKKLHHCVGGYAQRHADGKTNILMIRKVSAPNEPFYTMEIKNNKIVQCYGMRHSLPAADLQAFIEAFKAEKIAPKPKTVPLERQEVAV